MIIYCSTSGKKKKRKIERGKRRSKKRSEKRRPQKITLMNEEV